MVIKVGECKIRYRIAAYTMPLKFFILSYNTEGNFDKIGKKERDAPCPESLDIKSITVL